MTPLSPTALNLASQPFSRERARNALYGVLCVGLLCVLIALSGLILRERALARNLRASIAREQTRLNDLQRDQSVYSSVLGRPQNADVFATSVFLNDLIGRRAVSWTRVFHDLETVMPYNVRLVSVRLPQQIAEQVGGENHVQLDMLVGTDRPEAVIELLKRLQNSPLFGPAAVVTQQPPSQNDPLFRARVTVPYAQKL